MSRQTGSPAWRPRDAQTSSRPASCPPGNAMPWAWCREGSVGQARQVKGGVHGCDAQHSPSRQNALAERKPPPDTAAMKLAPALPIDAVLGELRAVLRTRTSAVLVAPPGAGKT